MFLNQGHLIFYHSPNLSCLGGGVIDGNAGMRMITVTTALTSTTTVAAIALDQPEVRNYAERFSDGSCQSYNNPTREV